jgi:hypothetical protein
MGKVKETNGSEREGRDEGETLKHEIPFKKQINRAANHERSG